MAPPTNAQLLTLINTTLNAFEPQSLQIAFDRNDYEVVNRWWPQDKITIQGGLQVQDQIIFGGNGTWRKVAPYEATQHNAVDVIATMTMPWTKSKAYYVFSRDEVIRNQAPRQIVDLIKPRRIPAAIDTANGMEAEAWATPDATLEKQARGVKYYVPQLAAGQAGQGFYGGMPTGFNDVAGIAPATSGSNTTAIAGGKPLWRSYCAGGTDYYTEMDATAVKTMRTMFRKLRFRSPILIDDLREGPSANQRIYANDKTVGLYEDMVTQANDNLDTDLMKYEGITVFKRIPIIYIEDLDADTMDPVYMLNHTFFGPYALSGDVMREHEAFEATPSQSDVFIVEMTNTYNYFCRNRQRQGVMNKTA